MKYILYVLLTALLIGGYYLFVRIPVIAGYTAKCACAQYFQNNRPLSDIAAEDFDPSILQMASVEADDEAKTVTSSVFGLRARTAQYRDGLGCRLIHGQNDHKIRFLRNPSPTLSDTIDWPIGTREIAHKPKGINNDLLQEIADYNFNSDGTMNDQKTRSLIVVYKDSIILEAYEKGFDKDTPLLGWSMTKSWMNTLIGMLVKDERLSITDSNLHSKWTDERSNITYDHLLTMSSGIDWEEDYSTISDATKMLYMSEDILSDAADNKLAYAPGEHWYYSSGTTNIISGLIRNQFENHTDYLQYPHKALFDQIGMNTAFIETDESGTYIGSSYGYASTRDWAKYGLLYLHDGVWNGNRLLPEGWVDYTTTEVPDSDGHYGAHFWLNKRGNEMPNVPHDTYYASGYHGQRVSIIPSRDLVIVRTGINSDYNFDGLISNVIKAINYE